MESAEIVASPEKLSLKIHETITTLQNENGLRHQDHMRYRHYLSRKLKSVRKSVNFTFGKGRVFTNREITPEMVTNSTFLLIPLLTAERAWSHASELKDVFTKVGKNKIKHSEVGKFSKAAKWAKLLESLCSTVGDGHTVLEATAYSSWMSGQAFLEKEMWSEAVVSITNAKSIYDELSKHGSLDQQDLFAQRSADLEPTLRFCRYNVSGSGIDVKDLDLDALSSNPDLQSKLEEIRLKQQPGNITSAADKLGFHWAGKPVVVSSEVLVTACAKIKTALDALETTSSSTSTSKVTENQEDGLGKARNQAYMRVLSAIDNTNLLVSDDLNKLALGGGGRLGDVKTELNHLKHFLQFERQAILLRRTTELINSIGSINSISTSSEKKVYDLAHLYDQQLDTVREMLSVPGCEEDDILTLRLSAQEQICRAMRALHVSECYVIEAKWNESSVFIDLADSVVATAYNRVDDLSEAITSSQSVAEEEKITLEKLRSSLQSLEKQVMGARCRLPALALLYQHRLQKGILSSSTATEIKHDEVIGERGLIHAKDDGIKLSGSLLSRKNEWIDITTTTNTNTTKTDNINTKKTKISKGKKTDKMNFGTLSVIEIPPAFTPIPCKPVFFDIAFNYIEAPDISERAGIVNSIKKSAVNKDDGAPVGGLVGVAQNLFGWFRS
eukprot:gene6226-12614_t